MFTGGLICVIKELHNLVVNIFQRGLEMRTGIIKVLYAALCIFTVFCIISMLRADYLAAGWIRVVYDIVFAVAIYFLLRWILPSPIIFQLESCKVSLISFIGRLYTATARLPEGKFPNTISAMKNYEIVAYARRLLNDLDYWNEVPEMVPNISKDYVSVPYVAGKHEFVETKDAVREKLENIVSLLEQMNPMFKKK